MARSIFTSASAWLSSVTGGEAPEKRQVARLIDKAMGEAQAPKSKTLARQNHDALTAAKKGLKLIKTFPLYNYLVMLFADVTPFPSAEDMLVLAKVNAARIGLGQDPKPLPWDKEIWAAEALQTYEGYFRYAQALRRHGEEAADPLMVQADNVYDRFAIEVEALGDARLLAAYNVACDWCENMAMGTEADVRVRKEMSSVIEAENAARRARDAKRGRVDTADMLKDELVEMRKTFEKAAQVLADLTAPRQTSRAQS